MATLVHLLWCNFWVTYLRICNDWLVFKNWVAKAELKNSQGKLEWRQLQRRLFIGPNIVEESKEPSAGIKGSLPNQTTWKERMVEGSAEGKEHALQDVYMHVIDGHEYSNRQVRIAVSVGKGWWSIAKWSIVTGVGGICYLCCSYL